MLDCHLLDQLLTADAPIAVDRLRGSSANASGAAWVREQLALLRRAGCRIDEHPQHGVRLLETGLGTWADLLAHRFPGRIVEVYRQTASTQDVIRRLVDAQGAAADRAIVVTDSQSAGRGRLGRSWFAPAGRAVLVSVAVFQHASDAGQVQRGTVDLLTLTAAVAAARGIERAVRHAVRISIKWPNDLLIQQRKVAGILIETHTLRLPGHESTVTVAVVGMGINVHLQPNEIPEGELRSRLASLGMAGCEVDRLRILIEVLTAMEQAIAEPDHVLLAEWRNRCISLNRPVRLMNNGRTIEGHVIDLDPRDGLIVRTHSGQITHLPVATTTSVPAEAELS